MSSSTRDIEDVLIKILSGTGLYQQLDSAVEGEPPKALRHPAAFVFFAGDRDDTSGQRPATDMEFGILIFYKNLRLSDECQ